MDIASTTPRLTRRTAASGTPELPSFREVPLLSRRRRGGWATSGATLVEVMVVTALLTILMAAAAGSIYSGKLISRRLSDYTAALAVVQAKMEDIRAATYNPPNAPFGSTAVTLTNSSSIDLSQTGATFIVSGTVTSKIEPIASGHLVTVTGTFQTPRKPMIIILQSVVNKYSGGQ